MTKDHLKRITRLEAAHGLSRRDMKREYAEARAEVNGQIERLERSVRESGDYAHRDSASFMENLVRAWLRDDRETAERTEAGHPQQSGNISRLMAISGMRGSPPSMGSAF